MKLAEAFGIDGYTISTKFDITPVLEKALKSNKPCLINCIIDKDINVLPMVPAGADVNNPIMEIRTDD